jgi:hypothetical protein
VDELRRQRSVLVILLASCKTAQLEAFVVSD